MSEKISLKEAEKQVFAATFQDGLWDVLIGLFVLAFALAPVLSDPLGDFWSSAVLFGTWPLIWAIIVAIRRYVVAPRVGVVRFGQARIRRLMRFNMVMAGVLVVALLLGFASALLHESQLGAVLAWVPMAALGLMWLVLCSIAAYFLDYPWLYVYGALLLGATLIGEWLYRTHGVGHHGVPLTFGLSAALAIAVGLVRFARLLRDHPLPGDSANSEAGSHV